MVSRLAVCYAAESVSPLQLARTAAGRWELLWLVDQRTVSESQLPALRRFGELVDVSGQGIEQAAATLADHDPDGIVAYADEQLMFAADIAQHLGLRHNPPAVVRRLLDKHEQRRALNAAGIHVPRQCVVSRHLTDASLASTCEGISFPAVVKPRVGSGSRNTTLVGSLPHLRDVLGEFDSGSDEFVLEEFLGDGVARTDQVFADYVSVESAVADGNIRHIAVTGCFPLAAPFRESGNFVPSALGSEQCAMVKVLATAAISALGVTTGVLHTEIKLTPVGPRVIEVNGRIGGDIPDLLRLAAGREMFEISAQIALHARLPENVPAQCDQVAYILNVQAPQESTALVSLDGLDDVASFPDVEAVLMNRRPGDKLDWREGTYGYLYSVLGTAVDHDDLVQRRAKVLNHVRATYDH